MSSLGTPISYHRLMRQPLDDSEILTSASDLMTYCSSGAYYTGQRVVVNYSDGVSIPYIIVGTQPIIDIPGWEPVWYTSGSNTYMMVYYCNGTTFSNGSLFTRIDDPWKFMMLDTAPIFDSSSGNQTYIIRYKSTSSTGGSITTTSTFTASGNPVSGLNTTLSGVTIMPSSTYNYAVKMYVKANNYYDAMGVNG